MRFRGISREQAWHIVFWLILFAAAAASAGRALIG